ncbi:hypothetical protein [Salana multivorans]
MTELSRPVPRPPTSEGIPPLDTEGLLPDADELAQLPVRQHVAVFEALHARLAEQLDDTA